MATSKTEIANLALSHLGVGKEIANLDTENSQEAATMRRFYETCRLAMMRDFPWPFATKFAVLGLVASPPTEIEEEWLFSYRYPSDCLKMRRIVSGVSVGLETRQSRVLYQLGNDTTGELIYTNKEHAKAEYTLDIKTVERYSDDFVLAFSLRLASYGTTRLTKGDPFGLSNKLLALYQTHIDMAQASSVNEQQPPEDPQSEFIRARE